MAKFIVGLPFDDENFTKLKSNRKSLARVV